MTTPGEAPFSFIPDPAVRDKLVASYVRISRAYAELFSGYHLTAEQVLNEVVQVENYTGVVAVTDISFYTFCEHHFLPFFGKADVYYMPGKIVTGLGKIVRLVREVHARRLQIQETMTREIAADINRVLAPKGVLVATRAKHLCICSRGPSDDNVETAVEYDIGETSIIRSMRLKGAARVGHS